VTRLRACRWIPQDTCAEAETFLVAQAQHLHAAALAGVAKQLVDTLDPDGVLEDQERQQRLRFLSCVPTGAGMHRLTGDLDAETAALAMTVLHSLAAPKTGRATADGATADGTTATEATGTGATGTGATGAGATADRDERTAGQRMHDALRSVLKLALRSGELPQSGGIPATVLITMTAQEFTSGTGLATTSFGQKLPVAQALRLADQACLGWVVHNSTGGVINYGRSQRVADRRQTLALIARDGGCAFPGCTDPPEWTERHHIIPWSRGGPTDVDNLCLLCDFHHDRIDTHGWTIHMHQGVPWFTPPAWIDPEQKPRRNHHPPNLARQQLTITDADRPPPRQRDPVS